MQVVIIGSGNVAHALGRKIYKAGHIILQIAGRNEKHVKSLADELQADACVDIFSINRSADIYILAVSDSALNEIAKQLNLPGKIVVHTAGAVSKNVLQTCSENHGVLYPVQTFRKKIEYDLATPLLIDASNEPTLNDLQDFAKTWSDVVKQANDEERLKLHVAAVFVNNFTNHLFALTKNYCDNENLDFSFLEPMIEETVKRIKSHEPSEMQTGPAIRGDIATIQKHLELLKKYPQLTSIYEVITNSIAENAGRSYFF